MLQNGAIKRGQLYSRAQRESNAGFTLSDKIHHAFTNICDTTQLLVTDASLTLHLVSVLFTQAKQHLTVLPEDWREILC
ncbi:Uncharacterised protein [Vibrio cholerae]|nr:Uncharacterised protein [Vibrio cholerae]CSB85562.1 Uncharacterised protein [Vibrio cholerae]